MNKAIWPCIVVVLFGCSGGQGLRAVHQPISQQTVMGEARSKAKTHTELGAAYFQDKRLGTALDEARKAISLDRSYAPAHNLLALIYMELGQTQLAQDAFERALQLAPGDPDFSNNYGFFLCNSGQEKKAMEYFQAALADPLYSTPAAAMLNAASCSVRMKDDKSAEAFLLRALKLEPDNVRALYLMSDLYFRGGRLGEARMKISELHSQMEPTAESIWLALRIARGLGNRHDEAAYVSVLRRKFSASPEYQKLMQGLYQ